MDMSVINQHKLFKLIVETSKNVLFSNIYTEIIQNRDSFDIVLHMF